MGQYALLEPIELQPDESNFHVLDFWEYDLDDVLSKFKPGILALDFETRGTRSWVPGNYPVGVSLSDGELTVFLYFGTKESRAKEAVQTLKVALESRPQLRLIAHNVTFDSLWFSEWLPNWTYCTYALFKMLACEGWIGQTHSLKTAQVELLGWDERGDVEIEEWLVRNDLIRGSKSKKDDEAKRVRKWQAGKVSADKAEMWQVPMDILGRYACLDAYSTWHLWEGVLRPVFEMPIMHGLRDYWPSFLTLIETVREATISGIRVDRPAMIRYFGLLEEKRIKAEAALRTWPDVASLEAEMRENAIVAHRAKEPPLLTVKGEPSKRWEAWSTKLEQIEQATHFNPDSATQLKVLIYDRMGIPVKILTKKGNPSVGKPAFPTFGPIGSLLKNYKNLVKEMQFVEKGIEYSRRDGRIHPQFKVPGTMTMRLSGAGGLNVQQVPKSAGYLSTWIPDDGYVWIDQDVNALEQVVLAELSGDPTLLTLYGPGAAKNDVYLFNGAALPGIGEVIHKAGYDPDAPTPEGIAAAKATCKKERNIAKLVSLASAYRVGVKKLQTILETQGIVLPEKEVRRILEAYWKLYAGVKSYYDELEIEWKEKGGWIFDGLGIPMGVDQRKKRDLGNSICQRTGHSLLVLCIAELHRRRQAGETPPFTWIIPDFHDEMIVQCKEEDAEELARIMNVIMCKWLNEIIQPVHTRISGEAEIISNFAEAKLDSEGLQEWEDVKEELGW